MFARRLAGSVVARGVRSFAKKANKSTLRKCVSYGFATGASLTTLAVLTAPAFAKDAEVNIAEVRKALEAVIEENEDMGPTFVRLAWHASGTYDVKSNTGGSDGGTIRFKPEIAHGCNAGLAAAVTALEGVHKQFPGLTWADLITLVGVVSIEAMGGPQIGWRAGRIDAADGKACTPDGRLPDGDKGTPASTVQHLRDIFYRQGFNDQEIVALAGAHALGRCHRENSGYHGPWTRAPTTFSNEYFRELLDNKWCLKEQSKEHPDQWEDPSGDLMMLPADMALIWDRKFRHWVEVYAKDEERFFKDFANAFQKLEENGVRAFSTKKGWLF